MMVSLWLKSGGGVKRESRLDRTSRWPSSAKAPANGSGGSIDSIYKCDAGLNCAVSGSIFGCCRGANCGATSSNFFTTCLDYSEPACVSTLQGYFTLCCTSINWPYCYTGVSSYQGRSVTHYGCGNNVFTGYQPIVGTPRYASEISTTPSYTISVVTTPARPSTPSAPGNGGSAPVGAIVGGVIGGLAVISLTVFLIFWFAIKNKNSAAPPPMPGPQMAYAGAPGQPYDPNAPQNGQMLQPNVTGYPPSMNPGSPPPPSYVDPRFSTMGGYYAPNNGGVVNGKDLWSPTSTAPMLAPQNTGLSVDQQPSSGPTSPISSPNPDAAQLPSGPQQAQGQVGPYGQPLNQPVYEAPATNPAGMGNNRAELG